MTVASVLDSWITCRKPNPQARLRLFCFPYAGAGVVDFSRMVGRLASGC